MNGLLCGLCFFLIRHILKRRHAMQSFTSDDKSIQDFFTENIKISVEFHTFNNSCHFLAK